MKLADIKDANGTSLQSYAETLTRKCNEAGVLVCAIIAYGDDQLSVQTNLELSTIPTTLKKMANLIASKPTASVALAPESEILPS